MSQEQGQAYVAAIAGGATVTATLDVATEVRNASTFNVLATTKCGDQNNRLALGAHTDSVLAGPGINDDGSGVIGILEVAKALSKYEVKNAVTFGFWSGEEIDLLGSAFYVASLSPAENLKIRGYLNFDMVSWLFRSSVCVKAWACGEGVRSRKQHNVFQETVRLRLHSDPGDHQLLLSLLGTLKNS